MAVILSFIQTCRAMGIDPFVYLLDISERLLDHPANRLEELLPDRWLELREAQKEKSTQEVAGEILKEAS